MITGHCELLMLQDIAQLAVVFRRAGLEATVRISVGVIYPFPVPEVDADVL